MTVTKSVRIISGALDESPLRGGSIILRGVVDPACLTSLKVDNYQREVLPTTARSSLIKGLKSGQPFPDIELGMRGQRYTTREGVHYLLDDVFIIDGLQRVNATMRFLEMEPAAATRLGCVLHFDTDRTWERERFDVLNISRVRVSPNIILRNSREDYRITDLLYNLTTEATNFPLYNRVQWGQRMKREELITANQLLHTMARLHIHKGPLLGGNLRSTLQANDRLFELIGVNNLRNNLMAFYRLIDTAWGLTSVQIRELQPQLKGTFNFVLARLLSDHEDFWRNSDSSLFVDADFTRKFSTYPLRDPAYANLASSAGKAANILYSTLKDHINSGRRTGRLTLRDDVAPANESESSNEEATA
jgi:hypothetical protein